MIPQILFITVLSSVFLECTAQSGSNPCMPTLGGNEVVISVPESATIGDEVYNVTVPGNSSTVSLTASKSQYFSFNQVARKVVVSGILDAETKQSELFIITCKVVTTEAKVVISINIYITDANDHSPIFTQDMYNLTIGEMTDVNTIIQTSVEAIDNDYSPDYSIIFYSIVNGPYKDYFTIANPLKAYVTLLKPLDYETLPHFSITIMAMDQPTRGNVQFNATCTLIIIVEDQDDQNPVFNSSLYRGLITNMTTVGSVVPISPRIFAYDPDISLHARIVYSFHDTAHQNNSIFTIDPNTAKVRMISRPNADEIYLLVQASQVDNPSRYGVTLLTLQVQESNNNAPMFSRHSYQMTIPEVFPVGQIVTAVFAIDKDSGTTLTYGLNDPSQTFEIHQNKGDITLRKELSYVLKNKYTMLAIASDGMLESKVNVTIEVTPVHNSAPQILTTSLNVTAQRRQGEVIIDIEAHDSDNGTKLQYNLLSYNELFAISMTGIITIIADPSSLVLNMYPVTVVVSDGGQPSYERAAVVLVNFPSIPTAVSAQTVDGNNIAVIVLAALAAFLLIIIIILVVFICRRRLRDTEHLDRVKKQHPSQAPKVLAFKQKGSTLGRQTIVNINSGDNSDGFPNVQENPLNSDTKGGYYNFGILNNSDPEIENDIQELQMASQYELQHNDSNNNEHIYNTSQCSVDSDVPTSNNTVTPFYSNGSVSTYRDSSGSDVSFSSPQASSNSKKLLIPGSWKNGGTLSSSTVPSLNPRGSVGSPLQKQELTVYF